MGHSEQRQSRLKIILASILVILIFNGWFLHLNFKNVSEQEEWVGQTAQTLNELELIMSSMKDAETGARGFLLTNKEEFLEPYSKGSTEAWQHFNSFKELTRENTVQQSSLILLEVTVKKRFEILDGLIRKFRLSGGRIDRAALQFADGKSTMDSLRAQIEKMKSNERAFLLTRAVASDRSKQFFVWVLILTTVLSIAVIAFAFSQIAKNQTKSLIEVRTKELEAREKEFVAEVTRLIAGNISLQSAGLKILEFFSKNFNVLAGQMFVREQNRLHSVASFGVKNTQVDKVENKELRLQDNLIESAFSRMEVWEVNNVPENYWHISSSLGEGTPDTLVLLPFSFQGESIGVLELALFDKLTTENKKILEMVSSAIGVGINAAQARGHLQTLLERTQQQSEELLAQQEELKSSNEELEQQARALESQQQALHVKNRELEIAQAELERKAGDLQRSGQYKSEFLAKMSHELRTPLNSLLILSTLLIENKEKNLTKDQIQFARSIHSSGDDLLLLINDILDLSKIEARKLVLRKDEFTLQTLFESQRMTFDPQANAKKLELITTLPKELQSVKLHTDRQRLEQILRNFLSNSIKFTEKGRVQLSATFESPSTHIKFTVEDTGIGIPKNKQEAVFDAFEQADSSVSRRHGGTGLGLTISRELANLLGGEITLASEEGVGSKFSLIIPVELSNSTQDRKSPMSSLKTKPLAADSQLQPINEKSADLRNFAQASLSGVKSADKTILIVEDDDKFRSSVVETVRSCGFIPVEASSSEVALEILNHHTPGGILLDIKLPGISGLGILEMIKQLPHLRHIPVHMISAMEYQHSALRMGALGYLTKPVTIEKIRSALSRIENLISKRLKRVLLIEDDERQSQAVTELIGGTDIEVCSAKTGKVAVELLSKEAFDCIILDLTLPDVSGFDLLSELSTLEVSLPPIVIYTGKDLSDEEESYLRRYSESIIIKGVRSPERLLDEVNLFLHRVESLLPVEKREMLSNMRSQDKSFEDRTVLLVDDDIRNIFALTSALEARGLDVRVARDGIEALDALDKQTDIDLVIMDIMMPRMDGYEAMKRIRGNANEKISSVPIVALTAKAMKEDHEKCMEAGANDYLPKPVNLDNLTTVLKVWLEPRGFMG